jgi:hypothetical protein
MSKNDHLFDAYVLLRQVDKSRIWFVRSTGRLCSKPHCMFPVAVMRMRAVLDPDRGWCSVHVPQYVVEDYPA